MAEACPAEMWEVIGGIPAMSLAGNGKAIVLRDHREKASHIWFPFNEYVVSPVNATQILATPVEQAAMKKGVGPPLGAERLG